MLVVHSIVRCPSWPESDGGAVGVAPSAVGGVDGVAIAMSVRSVAALATQAPRKTPVTFG